MAVCVLDTIIKPPIGTDYKHFNKFISGIPVQYVTRTQAKWYCCPLTHACTIWRKEYVDGVVFNDDRFIVDTGNVFDEYYLKTIVDYSGALIPKHYYFHALGMWWFLGEQEEQ